jgi:3-oxoacyl-[acyl-carrier protein] reductase
LNLGLKGKVALVGGGSRGIGLAIAKTLAQEGCRVAIAARNQRDLDAAATALGAEVLAHSADLVDPAQCERLVSTVGAQHGRLDILITNAGSGASAPPGQETPQAWRTALDVNLATAMNLIAAARPLMARGGSSAIVCISSICGREALGAPVTYSAAKAALEAAVVGLSRPLAAERIRINCVAPGNILFEGGVWNRKRAEAPDAVANMLTREVPLGRFGAPEEIADAVAFLASDRSAFTTGTTLVVDGGQTRT